MSSIRRTTAVAVLVAACFAAPEVSGRQGRGAAADPHSYFNSLVRRNDHWKSYSLRDPAQIMEHRRGRPTPDASLAANYDPATDSHYQRQDATKITIPAFFATGKLAEAVSASATVITLESAPKSSFPRNRVIRVDREVMTVREWLSETTVGVNRASHGSTAAPHEVGAVVSHATNSLRNQIRVPLGTEDGHEYFFVWDAYWTDSFLGAGPFNHKAFQFSSGSRDGDSVWLEPAALYGASRRYPCFDPNVHVAAFHIRYYNRPGGDANWSATDGNSLGPGATPSSDFCILPNTWVRFFLRLQQRANDYDIVDMWVADETRDAVQVARNTPVSVRPSGLTPNSVAKFWVEFNSSDDEFLRLDSRDLVAYVRNFVALRDARNIESLLERPVGGSQSLPGPVAPRNVRIVR